jgi:hypothetical protein
MKGGIAPFGSRFEPELISLSVSKFRARRTGSSRSVRGRYLVFLALAAAVAPGRAASTERNMPVCLSLSPFRAVAALGSGQPRPEELRDEAIAQLDSSLDSSWTAAMAGSCPEHEAILDVFQSPSDIVASADGPTLRIHLEWHHQSGQTEFFLACPNRTLPSSATIAEQLLAVARQMSARIELHSVPEGADLRIAGMAAAQPRLQTPLVLKMPPGVLSVEFSRDGLVRRKDTVVSIGGLYEIRADFQKSRIDPQIHPDKRITWPWWAATSASLLATLGLQWEQNRAQRAYSDLGATATSAQFDSKWRDLRRANLLRNGFLGLTLVLGGGSAWMEWGPTR